MFIVDIVMLSFHGAISGLRGLVAYIFFAKTPGHKNVPA
jgi:hypothetical protein